MIRLNRPPSPSCLAPNEAQRLTEEYKQTGKSVWNFEDLKQALLATSYQKCAYCECRLSIEGKYVEVEHFLDKVRHPDHVVSWQNLLPSCKRCNGEKGGHDTVADPIMNPYRDNPQEHLSLNLYRLRGTTRVGETTREVLNLNDPDRMVKARFEIGEKLQESLLTTLDGLRKYRDDRTTRNRNRLVTQVRQLLLECAPSSAYAATCATVLHNSQDYLEINRKLAALNLWSAELEELHLQSLGLVLRTRQPQAIVHT
jgi:uncharacterized protein (TIGR02646 family)